MEGDRVSKAAGKLTEEVEQLHIVKGKETGKLQPFPLPLRSWVAMFLMIIFTKCQASAHLQIIVPHLHTRSRRPWLRIWKMECGINKINGLGQLVATATKANPQALCSRSMDEVCQSGD